MLLCYLKEKICPSIFDYIVFKHSTTLPFVVPQKT